jgi:hypothetical protein
VSRAISGKELTGQGMGDTTILDAVAMTTIALGGFVLVLFTSRNKDRMNFQILLFLTSLLLRLSVAVGVYQFGLVEVFGDEDSSGWYGGAELARHWIEAHDGPLQVLLQAPRAFTGHNLGYQYLLGFMFYVTPTINRMTAATLNCVIGALMVIFAYRTAAHLFSPWVATRVAWWSCFAPSFVIWSAQTVKEPVIIFLEAVALYACFQMRDRGLAVRHIFICIAAIVMLGSLRFYAAYIALVAVSIGLLAPRVDWRKNRMLQGLVVGTVIVFLLTSTGLMAGSEAHLENFDTRFVQQFRVGVASGGSGVQNNFDPGTPSGFVLGLLFGGAHLLLAPFPWQLGGGSARLLLTLPELTIWYWIFFAGVLKGFRALRGQYMKLAPMLVVLGGFFVLYSIMFGNIGLAYRQRAQLLPWLLMIGAYGLEQKHLEKIAKRIDLKNRFAAATTAREGPRVIVGHD